jgi:hypothetical protein
MKNDKASIEIIESIKELLIQLPSVSYGSNAIQYLNIKNYGGGAQGYDLLRNEFNELDLSKLAEYIDLDKKIISHKRELKEIENKHTNLSNIIGDTIEGKEGSVASQILISLKSEIEHLIKRRDELITNIEITEKEEDKRLAIQKEKEELLNEEYKFKSEKLEEIYKTKEEELVAKLKKSNDETSLKINTSIHDSNKRIKDVEDNATRKVKLINQFSDFLSETNDNMKLYSMVILGILIIAIVAIGFSIPNLLNIFDSYDVFIKSHSANITNWQIINYSLGLLIIKLPWALCLSAVLTGMYSLLKGLLITYEKINQDKRNMSAIYSISGNVAQSLNEYGIDLAEDVIVDDETGEEITTIRVSRKALIQKKESIRWNQIMKYFEKMQQHNEVIPQQNEDSKLKLVTNLLNKIIDKYPKLN